MESAKNPGSFAPQGWLPAPGLRQAHWGTHGWLKSAAGRAAGRELRTRGSAHWTGLYGAQERTSGDAAGYKSWPEGRSGRFGPRQPAAGLGADIRVRSAKLALTRALLRRVLAYERQCRPHGGHSAATRRALATMANGTPKHSAPAGSVSAGTHLIREWNGRTYQVEVLDNGYRFDGKTYPSLTTITKRITGTHWPGPRFFGLTPKRKA